MIVFLRHAERGDNQTPIKLSEIIYDPPLNDLSENTILTTSKELTQIFNRHGITKFKIISSRFLRCLMTARKLHKNLQKFGINMCADHYEIDDRISQYMREDWFSQYPLDKLIYHTEHRIKYFEEVPFKQKKIKQFPFPENYVHFHTRVMDFKDQLKFPNNDEALLIITHGFVVRQLSFTMNQMPKYQNQIKYCGYAAYMKGESGEILIKARL